MNRIIRFEKLSSVTVRVSHHAAEQILILNMPQISTESKATSGCSTLLAARSEHTAYV